MEQKLLWEKEIEEGLPKKYRPPELAADGVKTKISRKYKIQRENRLIPLCKKNLLICSRIREKLCSLLKPTNIVINVNNVFPAHATASGSSQMSKKRSMSLPRARKKTEIASAISSSEHFPEIADDAAPSTSLSRLDIDDTTAATPTGRSVGGKVPVRTTQKAHAAIAHLLKRAAAESGGSSTSNVRLQQQRQVEQPSISARPIFPAFRPSTGPYQVPSPSFGMTSSSFYGFHSAGSSPLTDGFDSGIRGGVSTSSKPSSRIFYCTIYSLQQDIRLTLVKTLFNFKFFSKRKLGNFASDIL